MLEDCVRGGTKKSRPVISEFEQCAAPGCDNAGERRVDGRPRTYCSGHVSRLKRHGDLLLYKPLVPHLKRGHPCSVESCNKPMFALRYCIAHYGRPKKHGSVFPDTPVRSRSSIKVNGLTLYKGKDGYRYLGRMLEHRLVMSEILGRPLTADENVHHINGIRDDNRPENLQLWNHGQPAGQDISDKLKFYTLLAEQYVPELRILLNQNPQIRRQLLDWKHEAFVSRRK